MNLLLALSFLSLLTTTANTTTTATTVGVTYNPSAAANLPTPEKVSSYLIHRLHVSSVNLLNPTPNAIRAFSYSNISLLLTLPNDHIADFAANSTASDQWVYDHVLPFHPRARISLISLGSDVLSPLPSGINPAADVDLTTVLLPAMRNLQKSLYDLGIRSIPVSTTFSFITAITSAFPPSSAEFQVPIDSLVIHPVLEFLKENHSSFLIDVFPYKVFKLRPEIPVGFAMFQEIPFNFRDDIATNSRYSNLFDMMVDGVVAALAKTGHQDLPIIVTQTGWPNAVNGSAVMEVSPTYAQMYLKGLMSHLESGMVTPLKKDGVAELYVHELFDEESDDAMNTSSSESYGILYPNMTRKVDFAFSGGVVEGPGWPMITLEVFIQVMGWCSLFVQVVL